MRASPGAPPTSAGQGSASGAPNGAAASAGALPDVGTELREGYAEVGDVTLHYVEAGDGPLIVLLHGFPEFWFGWRLQIAPLVAGGFRVGAARPRRHTHSAQ